MFDVTFIGHMCYDEIIPFKGTPHISPGSAVLCGALASARIGKRTAVITRLAEGDWCLLDELKQNNIYTYATTSLETTYSQVIHPSPNLDERQIFLLKSAGSFDVKDIPTLETQAVHLAGISDQEFNLHFIQSLQKWNCQLSIDLQSFVRQVNPVTKEVYFRDFSLKREIVAMMDLVKLDIVEAELLTGESELDNAARIIQTWGCPEVVITSAKGVLARVKDESFYETFTNRSSIGRTGRGDTTFAAYLAWRKIHTPSEALRFAAALVSIKMEKPGPFSGTLSDVIERLGQREVNT